MILIVASRRVGISLRSEDHNLTDRGTEEYLVLGFTLVVCGNGTLRGDTSILLDREALSAVQPNLRYR